jgi:hypothetical protein
MLASLPCMQWLVAPRGFELLPTGLRPHYTIRLRQADSAELGELLAALGPPVANLQYATSTI